MLKAGKTQYRQDVSSSKLIYKFNAILIKIPASYFVGDEQTDSKFYMEKDPD